MSTPTGDSKAEETHPTGTPSADDAGWLHAAVGVLIGERTGFYRLAAELLEPLKLHGAVVTDLNAVLDGFADRVWASCGTTRTALLRAADLVILVTAFCETVAASGIRYTTELGHEQADLTSDVVAELSVSPWGRSG